MLRRSFAVLFGVAVALSWVAPLCAAGAMSLKGHACCQAPKAPKDGPKPCCCRPLDSAAAHPEVLAPSSTPAALLPGAVSAARPLLSVCAVDGDPASARLDASPPVPTGLSPPASA